MPTQARRSTEAALAAFAQGLEAAFWRTLAGPERALERELGIVWDKWAAHAVDAAERDLDPIAALEELGPGLAVTPLRARMLAVMSGAADLVRALAERLKDAEAFTAERVRYAATMSLTRARGFQDAQKTQIRRVLADAAQPGRSPRAAAKDIREALGGTIGKSRARTIARTELHAAAGWAQWHEATRQAESYGLKFLKEWRSTHDHRVRPSHAAANGQRVGLEASFVVGGAALRFPGDPLGPGSQTINCRCVSVFVPARLADRIPQARPIEPTEAPEIPAPARRPPAAAPPPAPAPTPARPARPPRQRPQSDGPRYFVDPDAARVLGIPREELEPLAARLFKDLPNLKKARIAIRSRGSRVVIAAGYGKQFYIERDFARRRPGEPLVAHHAYFKLADSLQDKGIAAAMLRSALVEYERLGVGSIELTANLEVGGHAWARFGFSPVDPDAFRAMVRQRARRIFGNGGPDLDLIEDLLRYADDRDVAYAIAGLDNGAGDRPGKRVLMGSFWAAKIDLTDPVALGTLKAKLGR